LHFIRALFFRTPVSIIHNIALVCPHCLHLRQIVKPLGAVLEEDKNGDVFVASVSPGSNAAKAGLVPGERISMVSATFGNELWSVNGAGLGRVQKAIQVRVGNSVKLVVQNEQEKKKAAKAAAMSADEKAERFLAEQKQRDALLTQLNSESKEAAKGGFGLFKKNFGIWGNDEPQ